MPVPASRIRRCNDAPPATSADFVLYWMTSARRTDWNFALERAVEHCLKLNLPLLVLEPLRAGYRWACDRFHRFVIEGMIDNARACDRFGVTCYHYVEPHDGAGRGLLETLARRAALVVTDDWPAFFLPQMIATAAARLPVRLEAVDTNGLLPMHAADRTFATAYLFRRFLQRTLPAHLSELPQAEPLARLASRAGAGGRARIPQAVSERWPGGDPTESVRRLGELPVDHGVAPVSQRGGARTAAARLSDFVATLTDYAAARNHPDRDATSALSPYLHFGHISSHRIFAQIALWEGWNPDQLSDNAKGQRSGWWGMSESAEGFLDQLVTWRELGFNRCLHVDDYESYGALPEWARTTLAKHADDPREWLYTMEEFDRAATHDPLWNAAQRQLRREGRMHNYLRMLWGKKIVEWSKSPQVAREIMFALNDRYALDGRDPNSATGILWILGLHDRPWGPERPVLGKVRYMSSANTARKVRLRGYLKMYGD